MGPGLGGLESGLYCTVLYCTVLYCNVLYCTVLYCNVLYCSVLYSTVQRLESGLYCTVLYHTVQYRGWSLAACRNVSSLLGVSRVLSLSPSAVTVTTGDS